VTPTTLAKRTRRVTVDRLRALVFGRSPRSSVRASGRALLAAVAERFERFGAEETEKDRESEVTHAPKTSRGARFGQILAKKKPRPESGPSAWARVAQKSSLS
jgi:hypothetical protein